MVAVGWQALGQGLILVPTNTFTEEVLPEPFTAEVEPQPANLSLGRTGPTYPAGSLGGFRSSLQQLKEALTPAPFAPIGSFPTTAEQLLQNTPSRFRGLLPTDPSTGFQTLDLLRAAGLAIPGAGRFGAPLTPAMIPSAAQGVREALTMPSVARTAEELIPSGALRPPAPLPGGFPQAPPRR